MSFIATGSFSANADLTLLRAIASRVAAAPGGSCTVTWSPAVRVLPTNGAESVQSSQELSARHLRNELRESVLFRTPLQHLLSLAFLNLVRGVDYLTYHPAKV